MNAREQIEIVFDLLKQHLRQRKISYRELASQTGMSEANVKRIFSVHSCDMERLIQFCNASDLKFFDLMAAASRVGPYTFKISAEAEDYFCKNFDCFIFFREISAAKTVEIAITHAKVPKEKTKSFLKDLTRLGLLEKTGLSYELRHTGYLDLPKDSKLRRKIEEKWVPWFFNRVLNSRTDNSHMIEMFSTGLSDVHRLQFSEEIIRLFEKYREIGIADQRIGNRQFAPVAVCIGIGPYRVGRFEI